MIKYSVKLVDAAFLTLIPSKYIYSDVPITTCIL